LVVDEEEIPFSPLAVLSLFDLLDDAVAARASAESSAGVRASPMEQFM
jgi:hypothetical protein